MKKSVSVVLVFALLFTAATVVSRDYPQSFWDVTRDHWAFQQIAELVDRNVLNGYADGSFKPDVTVTRAEWAKIMVGALNKPSGGSAATYNDTHGHWANEWINAVKEYMRDFDIIVKYSILDTSRLKKKCLHFKEWIEKLENMK